MRKPNYSHTYYTCAYSTPRKNDPWRVSGGCENQARLLTGKHYALPNAGICHTCPFYTRGDKISTERAKK